MPSDISPMMIYKCRNASSSQALLEIQQGCRNEKTQRG
jgi:hypothetical protein